MVANLYSKSYLVYYILPAGRPGKKFRRLVEDRKVLE